MEEAELFILEDRKPNLWETIVDLLRDSELRLTMILVFTSTLALRFVGTLLLIFYIEVWDVDDRLAGVFFASCGTQIFFFLSFGILNQKYGLKVTYLIGFFALIFEFALLIAVKNLYFHVVLISLTSGFTPVLISGCLKSVIQDKTTLDQRSLGFSMYNCTLNFSAILLGLITELIFTFKGINFKSYAILFFVLLGISLLSFILVILFSKLKKKEGNHKQETRLSYILNQKRYWKTIIVFFISSIPLGTIFLPGILLPIYMERELGSTQGSGYYFACYSFMLGIFGILLNFISKVLNLYDCVIFGGFVIAAGPLLFAFGNNYYIIGIYITITAIGGSILEPRLIDYNGYASVNGHEGFYFGIGSCGYAFSLIYSGLISGFLLDNFCPENGKKESWKMWYLVSVLCLLASIILLVFRRVIEVIKNEQETNPFIITSKLS